MVSIIQAIILSIIQGITEWFPISSSGHLALIQDYFGFQNLPFDVFLHLASVIAVVVVFWKDIIKLMNLKEKSNLKYIFYLIIALIPAFIAGFLFKNQIKAAFSNPLYLGIFFIASGVLVYSTKFSKEKKDKPNFLDSLYIGIFQAFAVFPGISRSGATISSGMYRGLEKEKAVKFSFLLAIPVILGAAILEAKDFIAADINYTVLIISFIITLAVSLFTIKILLRIVRGEKFYLFGLYNFLIGILVLILHFFGKI